MTQIKRLIPTTVEKDMLSGQWQFDTIAANASAAFSILTNFGGLTLDPEYGLNAITGFKPDRLYRFRYGGSMNGSNGIVGVKLFDIQQGTYMSAETQFIGTTVSTTKTQVPVAQQTFWSTGFERLALRIVPFPSGSLTLRNSYSFFEVIEI